MFERRHLVGGAAVTEEFHPGFRNSTASYTVSLLNPKVISDLRLAEHGLQDPRAARSRTSCRCRTATRIAGRARAGEDRAGGRRASPRRDADRLPDYFAMLDAGRAPAARHLLKTPPTDLRRLRDIWSAISFGRHFRALPLTTQREIHGTVTRSAGDMLDHWFESDPVKALYGFDAVVGNYASPYTPGSAYVLLHHAFGEVNGKTGVWGHAVGGMGAITQAMAARGATPRRAHRDWTRRCSACWHRGRRVTGVELEDGRVFEARGVAANVGPKLLFLKMLDRRRRCPPDFAPTSSGWRVRLGHLPHERRAVGAAPFRRTARRRRRAPRLRHHHRALAGLHGPRLRRRAPRRACRGSP